MSGNSSERPIGSSCFAMMVSLTLVLIDGYIVSPTNQSQVRPFTEAMSLAERSKPDQPTEAVSLTEGNKPQCHDYNNTDSGLNFYGVISNCSTKIYISKCCKLSRIFVLDSQECLDYDSPVTSVILNRSYSGKYFFFKHYPTCPSNSHPDLKDLTTSVWPFLEDGQINTQGLATRDYCVDVFKYPGGALKMAAIVCIPNESQTLNHFLLAGCGISVVALSLTVAVHCLVKDLLQREGRLYFFHVTCLLASILSDFIIFKFSKEFSSTFCQLIGFLSHYCLMTTFSWLNVMCFDVWRKTRYLCKLQPMPSVRLRWYLLYGWGGPLSLSMLTVAAQYLVEPKTSAWWPAIISDYCWFSRIESWYIYLLAPTGLALSANMLFLSHTCLNTRHMARHVGRFGQDETQCEQDTAQCGQDVGSVVVNPVYGCNTPGGTRKLKRSATLGRVHRQTNHLANFQLQICLFSINAVVWFVQIVSRLFTLDRHWSFGDVLSSLQGLFISIIFISNRGKRQLLEHKFPQVFRLARSLCDRMKSFTCPQQSDEGHQIKVKRSSTWFFRSISNPTGVLDLTSSHSVENRPVLHCVIAIN